MENSNHFTVVTCHGWSGSNWLATALNLHPDVICTHSARNLVADGVTQDLRSTVLQRAKARGQRMVRTASETLEEIRKHGYAQVYACVHTIRARDLERFLDELPHNISVKSANLIRHPVNVVSSGVGQLKELTEFDVFTLNEITVTARDFAEKYYEICDKFDLDPCNREVLCRFDACSHLRYLEEDRSKATTMKNIYMEKVVSDRDYFKSVFENVMHGLKADDKYIDEVFRLGAINRHRETKGQNEIIDEWRCWPAYQQEMFRYFLDQTNLRDFYRRNNYDLNFV